MGWNSCDTVTRAGAQRFRRKHHALDRASFFEFPFSQFFERLQFERRGNCIHSSFEGVRYNRRGEIRRSTEVYQSGCQFEAELGTVVPNATCPTLRLNCPVARAKIIACAF